MGYVEPCPNCKVHCTVTPKLGGYFDGLVQERCKDLHCYRTGFTSFFYALTHRFVVINHGVIFSSEGAFAGAKCSILHPGRNTNYLPNITLDCYIFTQIFTHLISFVFQRTDWLKKMVLWYTILYKLKCPRTQLFVMLAWTLFLNLLDI